MNNDLRARAAARRARVLDALAPRDAALFPAAHVTLRSADSDYAFRQDSDFHYLTGYPEPDAVCVLVPGSATPYVLFVRPKDRDAEIWTGRRAGVEGARRHYDADAAYPIAELAPRLAELLRDVETLHVALGRNADFDRIVLDLVNEQRRTRPRTGRGIVALRDPALLVHELRLIKESWELDRMRAAASITAAAHAELMRVTRPGMRESELEAHIEHAFRRHGATGPAYGTIIGGGDNATILHYRDNCDPLREGDLVLVDAGCELELYAADVTRTFPVGAGFTPEQAALYDVVLEAQRAAIATVKPGGRFGDAHDAAVEVLCRGLVELKLLDGSPEEVRATNAYRAYYMHRTGHWLGLDVHDVGLYQVDGESRVLEPGMVVTVEPGLYVAADAEAAPAAFRGIGIRIEDDVLVTPAGNEVLTAAAPKDRHAIEALRAAMGAAS
jgi:Xaa-Pro aminopeptidase